MNQLNLVALSLILMISSHDALAAPTTGDNSIKDLYDYLLQREYAEPLSLDHQMERKAVRSPSLRLRFGRRSDPDVPLIKRENEIDNEVDQKPIRSPSMRLRFGRRNDPAMSLFNEEAMLYGNEPLTRKAQRTPSVRLRFGKRDSSLYDNEMNSFHRDDSAQLNHAEEK
ncbi:CLUMA_CG007746, isoform A [Clunio marinus]|uniref:CLUMA_CG007746, isoform A n=1 Tax=Clunio marinus TaxID=568069 RepID=A0A1J1I1L6_9DIPT|nr:CLUMA_CG007746, isoform A [Clunio marinus]